MRGARQHRRGIPILFVLAVTLTAGAIFFSAVIASAVKGRAATSERRAVSSNQDPTLALSISPVTWNGRPVIRVQNDSHTSLSHVFIQSWNEDILPVLAVGAELPKPLSDGELRNPPYTLAPGDSIWFVGVQKTKTEYVVNWLGQNGRGQYEVLSADLD